MVIVPSGACVIFTGAPSCRCGDVLLHVLVVPPALPGRPDVADDDREQRPYRRRDRVGPQRVPQRADHDAPANTGSSAHRQRGCSGTSGGAPSGCGPTSLAASHTGHTLSSSAVEISTSVRPVSAYTCRAAVACALAISACATSSAFAGLSSTVFSLEARSPTDRNGGSGSVPGSRVMASDRSVSSSTALSSSSRESAIDLMRTPASPSSIRSPGPAICSAAA